MTVVDSHCHQTDEQFKDDVQEVIEQARMAGVKKMIVPSVNLADAESVVTLVNQSEGLYGLAGVHPEEVIRNSMLHVEVDEWLAVIEKSKKIVGVGEIGVDFYWDKEKKTKGQQLQLFKAQMELARELKLPVAIHNRDAETEISQVLEKMGELPRGQFHCWSGSEEFLDWVLDKGFYVSFGGNVTFKNTQNLRGLAKKVPLDRLLLETDAPYLAPEPLRGQRNQPKNVKITLEFLAGWRGETVEGLARATTENVEKLFGV